MGNYVPCLQSKRKDADLICTMEKHCLVTVGATVGFPNLTRAALEPSFWGHLASRGFTSLRIQCGPDIDWATSDLDSKRSQVPQQLNVDVFKLSKNLMREEMTLCKPVEGKRGVGLIISHAGTGTILDAWKLAVPIIVVPNTSLLDDHQTELARHLSKEGYAIHSSTKLIISKTQSIRLTCYGRRTKLDGHHTRPTAVLPSNRSAFGTLRSWRRTRKRPHNWPKASRWDQATCMNMHSGITN